MNICRNQKFIINGAEWQSIEKVGKYWFLLPVNLDGSLGKSVDGMLMTDEELEDACV